ncbi:hypothetical protein [Nocardia cyriacigeorgica]|uniref:hypothetical protein n=1 Tax=Nocardia cyriacigeorgica TaxID=135487 RepID=UPI00273EAF97|nr:hypothetical protein [Nocardia cyriacigeorgica]
MSDCLSAEDLARRTSSAVDAAVAVARDLGLTVTDPRVLHDLFSVVVHLAPAPVVARIPTVLPGNGGLEGLARRQRSELNVAHWIAEQGPGDPAQPARVTRTR